MSDFAAYPSLRDRTVFVTGGASGIGKCMVEQFHAQGARVAFVDLNRDAGETLADSLPGSWFQGCDVTDTGALQSAVKAAAAATGSITVLINNVANDTRKKTAETTP
jgi:NAD(P)-dependent dehydrogenase (short-subunit alcohol dehydrogenase family)